MPRATVNPKLSQYQPSYRALFDLLSLLSGAYSTRDDWNKRGAKRQNRQGIPGKRQGGVEWVRVSAPPSIPAPAQSFGYEENQSGELILQTPARLPGHSGVGVDQLGPGEYVTEAHQNILANERKKGFVEWSKSKTHRDGREAMLRRAASQPAPGQYTQSSETTESRRKGKKVSPFFASKVNRLKSLDGDTSKAAREPRSWSWYLRPSPRRSTESPPRSFQRRTSFSAVRRIEWWGVSYQRITSRRARGRTKFPLPLSKLAMPLPIHTPPLSPSNRPHSVSRRIEARSNRDRERTGI